MDNTLKIDLKKAKELYPISPKEFQEELESTFGNSLFETKITDRIKTMADVYKTSGITKKQFNKTCIGLEPDEITYRQLKMIAKVLNEGWEPNWNDNNENKYYPYFNYKSENGGCASGFGFSYTGYAYWNAHTDVGSRLCFKTEELAEYVGKQFVEIYNTYLS